MKINSLSDLSSEYVILHLEDMDSYLDSMQESLLKLNFQGDILQAKTVKEALELCSHKKIDFIISDWNLPDSSGLEFLKTLRQQQKFKNTPFIMCTTMDEVKDMIDAVNEGVNDYVVKPWTNEDLEKKIILTLTTH